MPAWYSTAMRTEARRLGAALLGGLALPALLALPAIAQLPVRGNDPLADTASHALPVGEAFPWHISEAAAGKLRITFNPAPEHYLYAHAFGISLLSGDGEQALDFELPPGLAKNDPFFGDVVAYYDQVSVTLDLDRRIAPGAALRIEFQGCADWGFCYPPQQARYAFPSDRDQPQPSKSPRAAGGL